MATERFQKNSPSRRETDETPDSTYPDNVTWSHPNGVRFVMGQERGKECIKIYHPSGTMMEYFPEGDVSSLYKGERKDYHSAGMTSTTDHNADTHGSGHIKVTMGGGTHIEVSGDAGILVAGATALASLGDLGLSVKGNMYMGVDGNMNMNVKGNMNTLVGGKNYVGSGAPMTVQATQLNLNPSDGASGYTPGPGPGISA